MVHVKPKTTCYDKWRFVNQPKTTCHEKRRLVNQPKTTCHDKWRFVNQPKTTRCNQWFVVSWKPLENCNGWRWPTKTYDVVMGKPKNSQDEDWRWYGGVEKICDPRIVNEPCTRKSFLEDWQVQQLVTPCISMDNDFFIWTSTNIMFLSFCMYKIQLKEIIKMKTIDDLR